MEVKPLNDANKLILEVGKILTQYDTEQVYEMINQFNLAESASVVFDAMALQGEFNMYEGHGREKFWNNARFKKQFLELVVPLVKFLNEEEAKFRQENNS